MESKIATLNLCLGLKNKKLMIEEIIKQENIDVFCLQEVEIEHSFNKNLLDLRGFAFELENNSLKARVGIYVKNSIKYVRRMDLEGIDSHLVIIDISCLVKTIRIINIYRTFTPQGGVSARAKFRTQLEVIKMAMTNDTILLGDFNMDYSKQYDMQYAHRNLFSDFDEVMSDEFLVQLVKFETWSRLVELSSRASILDHIYVKDISIAKSLTSFKPCFGDHSAIMLNVAVNKSKPKTEFKRDWRKYSKELLLSRLSNADWNIKYDTVQDYWNHFENQLVIIVDSIVPYIEFIDKDVKHATPQLSKIN